MTNQPSNFKGLKRRDIHISFEPQDQRNIYTITQYLRSQGFPSTISSAVRFAVAREVTDLMKHGKIPDPID